jgi:hypothetical protein
VVDWMVSIGPQNGTSSELVEHVLVERNSWVGDRGQVALESNGANHVVVRNNTAIAIDTAIDTGTGTPGFSTWDDWRIYNNSHSSNGPSVSFLNVNKVTNWMVRNNLSSAPSSASYAPPLSLGNDTVVSNVDDSHNTWNYPSPVVANVSGTTYTLAQWQAQGKGTGCSNQDPLFVDAASDLHVNAGSPAIDTGMQFDGVFEDFADATRPLGNAPDRGAFER